jgi:hypothetical protein
MRQEVWSHGHLTELASIISLNRRLAATTSPEFARLAGKSLSMKFAPQLAAQLRNVVCQRYVPKTFMIAAWDGSQSGMEAMLNAYHLDVIRRHAVSR